MNFLGLTHPLCSSLAALRAQWVGMSPEMLPTSDGVLGRGAMASPEPSARHPWGCLRMLSPLLGTGLPRARCSPGRSEEKARRPLPTPRSFGIFAPKGARGFVWRDLLHNAGLEPSTR